MTSILLVRMCHPNSSAHAHIIVLLHLFFIITCQLNPLQTQPHQANQVQRKRPYAPRNNCPVSPWIHSIIVELLNIYKQTTVPTWGGTLGALDLASNFTTRFPFIAFATASSLGRLITSRTAGWKVPPPKGRWLVVLDGDNDDDNCCNDDKGSK